MKTTSVTARGLWVVVGKRERGVVQKVAGGTLRWGKYSAHCLGQCWYTGCDTVLKYCSMVPLGKLSFVTVSEYTIISILKP